VQSGHVGQRFQECRAKSLGDGISEALATSLTTRLHALAADGSLSTEVTGAECVSAMPQLWTWRSRRQQGHRSLVSYLSLDEPCGRLIVHSTTFARVNATSHRGQPRTTSSPGSTASRSIGGEDFTPLASRGECLLWPGAGRLSPALDQAPLWQPGMELFGSGISSRVVGRGSFWLRPRQPRSA
jgi:hypothetical protein